MTPNNLSDYSLQYAGTASPCLFPFTSAQCLVHFSDAFELQVLFVSQNIPQQRPRNNSEYKKKFTAREGFLLLI